MIKTKIRQFNISSENAINGNFKSIINVNLPDLTFHNDTRSVYLMVDHCEIPNSFYIVNYTNNMIKINNISYTIPVGNYNVNNLIIELLALLPVGFTITYSNISNKLTFGYTTSFIINASSSTINKVIGLDVIDLSSDITNKVLCPLIVNFLPIPTISFHSNFLKTNNYSTSDGSSDVFLCLQNNVGSLATINYTNQNNIKYLVQEKNITDFTITVTNADGFPLNFNGIDWYMSLLLLIEYTDNTVNTSFNSIINNNAF
jgi:hypothetical protein